MAEFQTSLRFNSRPGYYDSKVACFGQSQLETVFVKTCLLL